MACTEVSTQSEFQAAIGRGDCVHVHQGNWTASGSAQVTASRYVAVTTHGTRVRVVGGFVIETPLLDTAEKWCEFHGVEVKRGIAILFKAVEDDWRGSHKTAVTYKPGSVPKAPDWDGGVVECGGGLHFSPRPVMALQFCPEATKYVACPVRLSEIVMHPNGQYPEKVKAPGCCGKVYEVNIDGERIKAAKS